MLQFLLSLIICANYRIRVRAKCSYYQVGGISFPTDRCTNSTLLEDNSIISSGYYCHFGLFRTYIYYYKYNTPNCIGVPIQTFSSSCSPETCTCDINNSQSQCKFLNTFSYDTHVCFNDFKFKQQNLTVVTSQCINSIKLFEKNNTLYYSQYSNTNCDGNATSVDSTCYTLDYHHIDTDTNIDTDTDSVPYIYPTKPNTENNTFLFYGYSRGLFIGCIVCIIFFTTSCIIGCWMKKYRKKQQNQIADIHNNDEELNQEGIDNYHQLQDEDEDEDEVGEEEEEEEIDIIPGQNEMIQIDQNVVDQIISQYIDNNECDEDIPAAAYCDQQEIEVNEVSISEGNEGDIEPVEENQSTDDDDY